MAHVTVTVRHRTNEKNWCCVPTLFHFGGEMHHWQTHAGTEPKPELRQDVQLFSNTLERLCRAQGLRLRTLQQGGILSALFLVPRRVQEPKKLVYTLCTQAIQGISTCPMGAVAEPASSWPELEERRDALQRLLEWNLFLECPPTLLDCSTSSPRVQEPLNSETKRLEGRLFLALTNHDFDSAEQQLQALMEAVRGGSFVDLEKFRLRLFHSMELSAYLLGFRVGKEDLVSQIAPGFLGNFERCLTVTELHRIAQDFLHLLQRELWITAGGTDRILAAEQLAKTGYSDPALCMTGIANTLGVNVSQLSRDFKRAKNITLSDFIQTLRLEAAKKLLLHTGLSMERIAEQAGFSGVKSMYRAFLHWEGTTPGVFRQTGSLMEAQEMITLPNANK